MKVTCFCVTPLNANGTILDGFHAQYDKNTDYYYIGFGEYHPTSIARTGTCIGDFIDSGGKGYFAYIEYDKLCELPSVLVGDKE